MEANNSFQDDVRLSVVIMKNEFLKQIRGKRIMVYGILMAIILAALTGVILYMGDLDEYTPQVMGLNYISMVNLMVIIGVTLFTATSVVSEFEERTALILFNRPIKKISIYIGKFLGGFLMLTALMAVYYAIVMIICLALTGVPSELFESFGYAMCYIFATSGVAMMFSSLMKKSSTASIVTFFTLVLLFDVVFSVIAIIAELDDPWFMLNTAAQAVTESLSKPGSVDGFRVVGTLAVWGIIPLIIGFLKFNKKDF